MFRLHLGTSPELYMILTVIVVDTITDTGLFKVRDEAGSSSLVLQTDRTISYHLKQVKNE